MTRCGALLRLGYYPALAFWADKLVEREHDGRIDEHLVQRKIATPR